MGVNNLINKVMSYKDEHNLNVPAFDAEINKVIASGIFIPKDYTELLKAFNGGELFVPGTVFYGVTHFNNQPSLLDANKTNKLFSIPTNYLIIGHLNFGDIICINTEPPYDIIQWDHETDEEYLKWSNIEEFLNEQIEDYLEYKEGDV